MSTDKEWQDFFTMVDQDIQRLGLTADEAVSRWKIDSHELDASKKCTDCRRCNNTGIGRGYCTARGVWIEDILQLVTVAEHGYPCRYFN